MKAGVSLKPHTPVHLLEDIIQNIDLLLIMSVNPGFGGQKFIDNSYKKIQQAKELIEKSGSKALIEVDGGVGPSRSAKLVETGVDVLVAGTYVFSAENPIQRIKNLKTLKFD